MSSQSPRQYMEFSSTGDLIIEGRGIDARIDSFVLTSESAKLKAEYATMVASTSVRPDILRAKLPEDIPDGSLICLLKLLYPSVLGQLTLSTQREWALALILAVQWNLTSIRALAIANLEGSLQCPVERAVAGLVLGVQHWLDDGMKQVSKQVKPMGFDLSDVGEALQKKVQTLVADLRA